jgi:phytoene dehydrogenase-like protein
VSTHTDVPAWERAAARGADGARRRLLAGRLRSAVERALPGTWDRARFIELATPHTFERYTGRWRGLVGGVPQTPATAALGAFSHVSGTPGLVLAGDTVFPGQSTVGASLSGLAAARACGGRL